MVLTDWYKEPKKWKIINKKKAFFKGWTESHQVILDMLEEERKANEDLNTHTPFIRYTE